LGSALLKIGRISEIRERRKITIYRWVPWGATKETGPQFSIKTPDKDKFLVKSPRMGLTPRRID
jgi:hypothetical protein